MIRRILQMRENAQQHYLYYQNRIEPNKSFNFETKKKEKLKFSKNVQKKDGLRV